MSVLDARLFQRLYGVHYAASSILASLTCRLVHQRHPVLFISTWGRKKDRLMKSVCLSSTNHSLHTVRNHLQPLEHTNLLGIRHLSDGVSAHQPTNSSSLFARCSPVAFEQDTRNVPAHKTPAHFEVKLVHNSSIRQARFKGETVNKLLSKTKEEEIKTKKILQGKTLTVGAESNPAEWTGTYHVLDMYHPWAESS